MRLLRTSRPVDSYYSSTENITIAFLNLVHATTLLSATMLIYSLPATYLEMLLKNAESHYKEVNVWRARRIMLTSIIAHSTK